MTHAISLALAEQELHLCLAYSKLGLQNHYSDNLGEVPEQCWSGFEELTQKINWGATDCPFGMRETLNA